MGGHRHQEKEQVRDNSGEYLRNLIYLSEGIYHDCKNLLTTISGLAQISVLNPNSYQLIKNMDSIKKATSQCRDIMDKFYGFINGYDIDTSESVIFSSIVLKTMEMIDYKLKILSNKGIKIDVKYNIQSFGRIYTNEYMMKQGILNMLLNALDAMESQGGTLEINLYDKGKELFLEIKDTGVGISKEDMDRIFDANFTTKGIKGTGLGLKIAKINIEKDGGRIQVKSKLNKGTTFTIVLPLVKERKSLYNN